MTSTISANRRYFWIFLTPIAIFAAAIGLSLLFLYRGGELTEIKVIAAAQQVNGGLYGTAIHNDVYAYKLALAAERKPIVAVIGSSRVLTIRQDFFTAPLVNVGLMASSAQQLEVSVDDLLRVARPAVVLIGIDFFWANPRWVGPLDIINQGQKSRRITPSKLVAPYRWLDDGQVTAASFWSSILGSPPQVLSLPVYGWKARLQGEGYSPEGEWIYGATIYGRSPASDAGFADTLGRVAAGTSQFIQGNDIDPLAVEAIKRTLRRLDQAGIQAVTYLPSLAPAVLASVRAQPDRYAYIDRFRQVLRSLSPHHLDALDIQPMGGSDCEFVDGFHPGEVAVARILIALSGTPLGPYLDQPRLRKALDTRAGRATTDDRYAGKDEAEVDFLKLGCRKN